MTALLAKIDSSLPQTRATTLAAHAPTSTAAAAAAASVAASLFAQKKAKTSPIASAAAADEPTRPTSAVADDDEDEELVLNNDFNFHTPTFASRHPHRRKRPLRSEFDLTPNVNFFVFRFLAFCML